MADLKKLALGRKALTKPGKPDGAIQPSKPAKKLEESCKEEVGELEAAFRERLAKEDKRRAAATDGETWLCVYFKTRQEKHAFLRKHGLDKVGDKFLDGRLADRVLTNRTIVRDSHRIGR